MLRIRSPRRVDVLVAICTVWVAFSLGACSTISPERPQPLELKSLRVAVTKTIDSIPLRLAVKRGLFDRAGLPVRLLERSDYRAVLAAVVSGDADVGLSGNFMLLQTAADGAPFQLQGEAYITGRNTMALVALPGHGYDESTDDRTPVIGIEPDRELGQLATRARLATEGIDAKKVRFTTLDFDEMISALQRDEIDAAWMTEPQISRAQQAHGARIVTDTALGALLEFPVSSYVAMRERAQDNPRTFAVFRETLARAQELAHNPSNVRAELTALIPSLDKTTAELVSLGSFPTSLSSVRLQRVADLMHRSGAVPGRIDVAALLPPA